MAHFYFLLGLGAVAFLAFLLSVRRSLRSRFRLPYSADKTLFTPAQRAFKSVLEQAVGTDYRVYGRVRMADIIGLQAGLSRREQERAQVRLGARSFDFLICTPDTTAIVCAVNLSPRSRRRKPPRDGVDQICTAARLPYVRFRESAVYSLADIADQIFAAMRPRGVGPRDGEIHPADAAAVLHGLSAVILDSDAETAGRRRPPATSRRPGSRPSPAQPVWSDPAQSRLQSRREPSILDDIDAGSAHWSDGDPEDARSARIRQG
jgi:hypothetical protein